MSNEILIVQFINQIKSEFMIHGNVSVKVILYTKTVIVGNLAHVFVRLLSI